MVSVRGSCESARTHTGTMAVTIAPRNPTPHRHPNPKRNRKPYPQAVNYTNTPVYMHLCDFVPVVDNCLSMPVDVYVRAERARATKATTLSFRGWFPNVILSRDDYVRPATAIESRFPFKHRHGMGISLVPVNNPDVYMYIHLHVCILIYYDVCACVCIK